MKAVRLGDRSAMTLLELLVVIAVMAILVSLALPAVQQVRETAAQSTCRNNLKQIGVAMHGYHNAAGSLPPAYVFDENTPPPDWVTFNTFPGWGWAALLLPYLEQSNLAQQIQWKKAVEDPDNDAIRLQILKSFVCPSDTGAGVFMVQSQYNKSLADAASNSYAACYGFGGHIGEAPTLGNGVFYRNSRTRIIDIRDGAANTLAVGERAALFCPTPWAGCMTDGTIRTNPNAPNFLAAIEEAPVLVMARTNLYPLNMDYSSPYDFYTPHPNAGLFLFADGSVRALRYDLSSDMWQALATRAGGETISETDY